MSFRKTASPAAIRTEVCSLRWLADAEGAPVAELLEHGEDYLVTATLSDGHPTREQAREFGRRLAFTHAAGAFWGQVPPGLATSDARLAELPLTVTDQPRWGSFGEFYAQTRLEPFLHSSAYDADALQVVRRAIERIASGAWDAPQPALVSAPAARIHGDLWGGNVLWPHGVGTLIDPCAHGGHAESDLAQLTVFGAPHVAEIYAGYDEASALADGWQDRIPVHQFHMILVHVRLFGGGYLGRAVELARRICAV